MSNARHERSAPRTLQFSDAGRCCFRAEVLRMSGASGVGRMDTGGRVSPFKPSFGLNGTAMLDFGESGATTAAVPPKDKRGRAKLHHEATPCQQIQPTRSPNHPQVNPPNAPKTAKMHDSGHFDPLAARKPFRMKSLCKMYSISNPLPAAKKRLKLTKVHLF